MSSSIAVATAIPAASPLIASGGNRSKAFEQAVCLSGKPTAIRVVSETPLSRPTALCWCDGEAVARDGESVALAARLISSGAWRERQYGKSGTPCAEIAGECTNRLRASSRPRTNHIPGSYGIDRARGIIVASAAAAASLSEYGMVW
eukprot:651144-Pleurochrysis_carterae.AAC.4